MDASNLAAREGAQLIREGRLSSVDLVGACLARIEAREATVGAWIHLEPERALAAAHAADERQRRGAALGALHGVPVGIKDIFDTHDYPTECGSPLFSGRRPPSDATVVARLRGAGAIILGKTVTTEFASVHPGKTRHPMDPTRTPGGSSSGSAAAVADGMVPLALGSQTAGSTIRPGSFCGVVAFKPQFGAIPRGGCMMLSRSLDHVGLYARNTPDVALLAEVLYGADPDDPESGTVAGEGLLEMATRASAAAPRVAFVPTPFWERADAHTQGAFERLVGRLGVPTLDLADEFRHALDWLETLCDAEIALHFDDIHRTRADGLSPKFRAEVEHGQGLSALDYLRARQGQARLRARLDEHLAAYDAFITPATRGEAPFGLASTGDPVFCTPWTLCGNPAVTLPLLQGENGLPLGVQLVGPTRCDAALLQTAAWLVSLAAEPAGRAD